MSKNVHVPSKIIFLTIVFIGLQSRARAQNEFLKHWDRLPTELQLMITKRVVGSNPFWLYSSNVFTHPSIETIRPIWTLPKRARCARFSSSGRYIVTGHHDGFIRIWRVNNHDLIAEFKCGSGRVYDAQFSANERYVMGAGADKTAQLWDIESGTCVMTFRHRAAVLSAALSPDGTYAATLSRDDAVRVWECATGKCIRHIDVASEFDKVWVSFTDNGNRVKVQASDSYYQEYWWREGRFGPFGQRDIYYNFNSGDGRYGLRRTYNATCVYDKCKKESVASLLYSRRAKIARTSTDQRYVVTISLDHDIRMYDMHKPKTRLLALDYSIEQVLLMKLFEDVCIENRPYKLGGDIAPQADERYLKEILDSLDVEVRNILISKYRLITPSRDGYLIHPHDRLHMIGEEWVNKRSRLK